MSATDLLNLTSGVPVVLLIGVALTAVAGGVLVWAVRKGRRIWRRVAIVMTVVSLLGGTGGQGALAWAGGKYRTAVAATVVNGVADKYGWDVPGPVDVTATGATLDATDPSGVTRHIEASWRDLSAEQVQAVADLVRSGATPSQIKAAFPQITYTVS